MITQPPVKKRSMWGFLLIIAVVLFFATLLYRFHSSKTGEQMLVNMSQFVDTNHVLVFVLITICTALSIFYFFKKNIFGGVSFVILFMIAGKLDYVTHFRFFFSIIPGVPATVFYILCILHKTKIIDLSKFLEPFK